VSAVDTDLRQVQRLRCGSQKMHVTQQLNPLKDELRATGDFGTLRSNFACPSKAGGSLSHSDDLRANDV
jgi:hypothetical protein